MSNYISYNTLAATNADPVSDYFNDSTGQWSNYGGFSSTQITQLNKQKHTDIRTFPSNVVEPRRFLELFSKTMSDLSTTTMENLAIGTTTVKESWTVDSGPATANISTSSSGWRKLDVNITGTSLVTVSSTNSAIDLGLYSNSDKISVALPSLPALTFASCYIDFSDGTNVADMQFSIYGANATGNKELTFTIANLKTRNSSLNLSAITKISFRLVGSNGLTFSCMGIRCVSSDWKYAPIDFNTVSKSICKPFPPNGNSTTYDFPTNSDNVLPNDWPALFRSFDTTFTSDGPQITSGQIESTLYTSSSDDATISQPNKFTIYYRAKSKLPDQIDLEGKSQAELNATGTFSAYASLKLPNRQANISKIDGALKSSTLPNGQSYQENPLPYASFAGKTQTQLNALTQSSLNFVTSTDNLDYLAISLLWYRSSGTPVYKIRVENPSTILYDFVIDNPSNLQNSTLIFAPSVNDNSMSVKLYKVDDNKNISLVYDSGKIFSPEILRNRGKIGWYASFADGGVLINDIRSNGLAYAEFKTNVINSFTPVKGAKIAVDHSEPLEQFNYPDKNIFTVWNNTIISTDLDKNKSSASIKVDAAVNKLQGIQTGKFQIEDKKDLVIKSQLWVPTGVKLFAFLYSEDEKFYIPVNISEYNKNEWSKVEFKISNNPYLSGFYRLVIVKTPSAIKTNWWVGKTTITQRQMQWESRSAIIDPWQSDSENWIDYYNNVNNANGSVKFSQSDSQLQTRGQAKSYYAFIKSVKIEPSYQTLGNLIWRD